MTRALVADTCRTCLRPLSGCTSTYCWETRLRAFNLEEKRMGILGSLSTPFQLTEIESTRIATGPLVLPENPDIRYAFAHQVIDRLRDAKPKFFATFTQE